ncbi:phenylacetate--CoA ligase [Bacteroides acidifaciens]|uniref:phenylacetate--CoA ligase family protein n=1 Tax=Bacteroides acidifaciens TaxID=85831 RepID=UPI0030151AF8
MIWNKNKECMSRDELHNLQGRRLRKLVDLVYHNTPFYRHKMQELDLVPDDIRTIDDIVKLPFTTKADLRDNYPVGLLATPMSEIVRVHASSGTTGNPTIVGYTHRDLEIWKEVIARALTAYGVTRGDIVSVGYGYGLFTGGLGAHYGVEHLGATVLPTSTGNTEKHIRLLRDLNVTAIACTPSYALYLAEMIRNQGVSINDLKLHTGVFGAEPWTENMRHEIEEQLGLKAYNIYGLSEIMGPGVAYECNCKNGSHIAEDHFYPEIINSETGEVLPIGQEGELVLTTLTKTGMPLLRYRTKDLTALMPGICDCGRTNIRFTRILGRSDDMLIIRGINVFPSQVENVILEMPEFAPCYMLVVDRKNNMDILEIQVELRPDSFSDDIGSMLALRKRLVERLKSVLSINAEVKLMEPNSLPRSEGKSMRVIDKRVLV